MTESNEHLYCSNCGHTLCILESSERLFQVDAKGVIVKLYGDDEANVCFFFACIGCGKTYEAIETTDAGSSLRKFTMGKLIKNKCCLLPDKSDCPYCQGSW